MADRMPQDNDTWDENLTEKNPLQGKRTLGKPTAPLIRPRRRLRSLKNVVLSLFFVFVLGMLLASLSARGQIATSCGLFAFAAMFGGLFCATLDNRRHCKLHTVGQIVDVRVQCTRYARTHIPIVSYTVDGQFYRTNGPVSIRYPKLGTNVTVYYDPETPEAATCHIVSVAALIVYGLLMVAFIVGGIVALCL